MKWIAVGLASSLGISVTVASSLSLEALISQDPFADTILQDAAPQSITTRNATAPRLFSRFLHQLDARQEAGRCGPSAGGASCTGSQCCSTFDYCGTDPEHCGIIVGCQPQYGRCGDAPPDTPSPTPTPTPTPSPSSSSTVVSASSSTVVPSSSSILPSSSSVLPPLPSGTLIVSPNGQCGNITTCAGSGFGSCCSEWYFCGSGLQYCGTGCRSSFGTCSGVAPPPSSSVPAPISSSSSSSTSSAIGTTTTPTPTPTPTSTATPTPTTTSSAPPVPTNVSTNGRCGAEGSGMTCSGSTYGRCCSDYGWCGTGDDFCLPSWGCRPQFGSCGST
ncbi:hypothetical protein HBI56_138110 [Parastagonospora nodorum]|nr:hypothetical protein HBI10_157790 [Parastagonospora nodorum]KAH4018941.1 hypothetical protein HBI13_128280 [Parastagonospora nodorum]KAH4394635.1 hypothetical protein HBH99_135570 [Parastagonospora nodorum]KAH5196979.1 hypothetical protein HBH68_132810 [Parastagonospora nodorum]KAH6462025.1 hypothetical protein HBI57_071960 [Parastagonospora nodorum]